MLSYSYVISLKLTNEFDHSWKISVVLGLSTCIAIYISIFVSGAHLNPIITLLFFLFFNFNPKKVIPYITSQIFGSFFSSMLVYEWYYHLLIHFKKKKIIRGNLDSLELTSIFSFFPNNKINIVQLFAIEIVVSCIFIFIILILNDSKRSFFVKMIISPILIGILVFIIDFCISPITNFTLNPAHDIGSRIFIFLSEWEKITFTSGLNMIYFFVPIFGTIIGSIMSFYIYTYIKKLNFL